MNIRNLTAVVLIPLIVLLSVTPAHAIFGSILAGIQRAQMIVNQGIQITNQVRQITTMGGQLTELKDQFRHLKDQALGSVGALTQSFSDLASVPSALVSDGMGWKNDFTGEALGLVNAVEEMGNSGKSFTQSWRTKLQQADRVSEQDILTCSPISLPCWPGPLPRTTATRESGAISVWCSIMPSRTRRPS